MKLIRKVVTPACLAGVTYVEYHVLCGLLLSSFMWVVYLIYKIVVHEK